MFKPFLSHRYGRLLLLCFFSFCVLEIWLHLSATTEPSKTGVLHQLEGLLSLLLLLCGYLAGLRYFLDESKLSVAGWVLIPTVLMALFFMPFTPLPTSRWKIEVSKSGRLALQCRGLQNFAISALSPNPSIMLRLEATISTFSEAGKKW